MEVLEAAQLEDLEKDLLQQSIQHLLQDSDEMWRASLQFGLATSAQDSSTLAFGIVDQALVVPWSKHVKTLRPLPWPFSLANLGLCVNMCQLSLAPCQNAV